MKILLGIIAACLLFIVCEKSYSKFIAYAIKENVAIKACAMPKIEKFIPKELAIDMCETRLNKTYRAWVYT